MAVISKDSSRKSQTRRKTAVRVLEAAMLPWKQGCTLAATQPLSPDAAKCPPHTSLEVQISVSRGDNGRLQRKSGGREWSSAGAGFPHTGPSPATPAASAYRAQGWPWSSPHPGAFSAHPLPRTPELWSPGVPGSDGTPCTSSGASVKALVLTPGRKLQHGEMCRIHFGGLFPTTLRAGLPGRWETLTSSN